VNPGEGEEPDDGALAARALAGHEDAYRLLMARHRVPVHRFVRAQVADADAALDIVQESFIAAFAHLGRYDRDRPFRHWLMRIALNKCRDHRRRQIVRGFFARARPLDEGLHVAGAEPGADAEIGGRQELRRARQAIDALPEKLRSVLLLRTVEGMSQAEVAALLGVSGKSVETRLYRARLKLSEMLGPTPTP
jgi:RNA polymerase sigma-70 factor (ECF subfamily)